MLTNPTCERQTPVSSLDSLLVCADTAAFVPPQVRLRYDAEIAQQSDGGEAVGAALDQKLPVRGAVEEDAPQLLLSRAASCRARCGQRDGSSSREPGMQLLPSFSALKRGSNSPRSESWKGVTGLPGR